ncbi:MAG: alpha/beta hydrolase [Pseudomonadota bacterium]
MHPIAWALAALLLALILGVGAVRVLQDRFIYFPDRTPPRLEGPGLERVRATEVVTEDGLSLLAWVVPPLREDAPVVLYLHGNGGHLGDRRRRLARFAGLGWGALMVEWRGYGGNPGQSSEAGLLRDARAGLVALRAMGHGPGRIVIWGESLGTAVAIALAAEQQGAVGALVLELPLTSLADLAALHFPWLPAPRWLLRDRFDSRGAIARVTAPVLLLAGGEDRLTPPAMAEALEAAAAGPVERWVAPLAGHEELATAGGFDVVTEFLGRRLDLR